MKKILVLSVLLTVCLISFAHPHVYIETGVTVCMDGKGIKKLKIKFTFDKMFSFDLKDGFDTNGDGKFDQTEITNLEENAFCNLEKYDYFIHMKLGSEAIDTKNVSNFYAEIDGDEVFYTFDIYLGFAYKKLKKK